MKFILEKIINSYSSSFYDYYSVFNINSNLILIFFLNKKYYEKLFFFYHE